MNFVYPLQDSGGEQRGIHDNRDRQWLRSVLEPLEFEKDDFFQKKKIGDQFKFEQNYKEAWLNRHIPRTSI